MNENDFLGWLFHKGRKRLKEIKQGKGVDNAELPSG